MKSGKRYAEAMKNVDRAALYDIADAITLVKKNASATAVQVQRKCAGQLRRSN